MSQLIHDQLNNYHHRLAACFSGNTLRLSVAKTDEGASPSGFSHHVRVSHPITHAEIHYSQSWVDFEDAIDQLMTQADITTVEQYIRIKAYNAKGGAK